MKSTGKKIVYQEVESSNVSGVYYNAESKQLYVKFKNGREYRYEDVSDEEFKDLIKSGKSFGKTLHSMIINQKDFVEIW